MIRSLVPRDVGKPKIEAAPSTAKTPVGGVLDLPRIYRDEQPATARRRADLAAMTAADRKNPPDG